MTKQQVAGFSILTLNVLATMVALGTEATLSCMARVMCWVAADQGSPIQFECDLGVVGIEPKQQPLQS